MTSNRRNMEFGVLQDDVSDVQMPPAQGEGCELPLTFNIGASVRCNDGRCGKLARVVIDPVTDR